MPPKAALLTRTPRITDSQWAGRFPPKIHKIRSGEQALKSFCVFYFVDFRAANKQNGICAIKITQSSRDTLKKRRLEENCNEFYFSWILCETFGSSGLRNRTFCFVVLLLFCFEIYGTGKRCAHIILSFLSSIAGSSSFLKLSFVRACQSDFITLLK